MWPASVPDPAAPAGLRPTRSGYTLGMPVDVHAEVLSNTRLSPDYNVLALAAPEIARQAKPGQFVMIKTRLGLEPLLRRPFSVFELLRGADGQLTGITILNKRIGTGTGQLYDLVAGDRVDVLGPLGRPFTPVAGSSASANSGAFTGTGSGAGAGTGAGAGAGAAGSSSAARVAPATAASAAAGAPAPAAWLVAGGVGLAPFATMAESLLAAGVETTLFYGARRAQDLYYADWFAARGVTVVTATEDGSAGARGFVTAPLAAAFAARTAGQGAASAIAGSAIANSVPIGDAPSGAAAGAAAASGLAAVSSAPAAAALSIYVCGPTPMMRAVSDLAAQHGCDAEVSLEQTMGCGLGGCYSCVVRVREDGRTPHFVRSCVAGPIFRGRDIVWEELAH